MACHSTSSTLCFVAEMNLLDFNHALKLTLEAASNA